MTAPTGENAKYAKELDVLRDIETRLERARIDLRHTATLPLERAESYAAQAEGELRHARNLLASAIDELEARS